MLHSVASEAHARGGDSPALRIATWEQYVALFRGAEGRRARGEGSVFYLYLHSVAIPEIRLRLGDPRIIICVRNPVQRLFSHYLYQRFTLKRFGDSFEAFCAPNRHHPYLDSLVGENRFVFQGRYAAQIERYQQNFSNVHVVVLEDLHRNPSEEMQKIFRFLGVDETISTRSHIRQLRGGKQRLPMAHRFLRRSFSMMQPFLDAAIGRASSSRLRSFLGDLAYSRPMMKPETREQLLALYEPEICAMEDLLRRPLPNWRI
jgi:hypothetical protein